MSLWLTFVLCINWVALLAGFCGIGVLGLRRLTGLEPGWRNAYLGVWAGFGMLMAGLLLWHFFLPVNQRTLWVFTLAAVISLALEWRWFAATFSKGVNIWFVLAIGAFSLWAANHALARGGMDDYNYEFQAIRWFHEYRIVPGLANLHGRIGFNNSHHLFAAMVSFGPWAGAANHVFNGLFTVLAFILLADAVRELSSGRTSAHLVVGACLLAPCVGLVVFGIFGPMISTLKADVFVCAATAALAVLFIEFSQTSARHERHLPLGATILLLSAVLLSVKISAGVFSGILSAAVVIRLAVTVGWRHRVTVCATLAAALIVCLVLLRGVFLSGYPLYPSTLLQANVDWRVPVAQAEAERAMITSWARLRPSYDVAALTGWAWLRPWAGSTVLTDKFNIVLPAILTLLCLPLWMTRHRVMRPDSSARWGLATLSAASLLTLLVWFVQAPAGRFAFIHFWILFATTLAISVNRFSRPPWLALAVGAGVTLGVTAYILFFVLGVPTEFRAGMAALMGLAALWTAASALAIAKQNARLLAALCLMLGLYQISDRLIANVLRWRVAQIRQILWLPIATLSDDVQKSPYAPRQTYQGLTVNEVLYPQYDTPLPNTRFFNPWLQLRVPGDLSSGFRNPKSQNSAGYAYSVRIVATEEEKEKKVIVPDR